METKRFQMKDEAFVCAVCGHKVAPNGVTSRDHCPKCLSSLHVDIMPGDRQNPCRGPMRPIHAEPDARRGYIITHKCEVCGAIGRNRATRLREGEGEDDLSLLIALTAARD